MPILPLRGVLVFPDTLLHFDVGRERSIQALEEAMAAEQRVFLVSQRDAEVDAPTQEDLYTIGTLSTIKQIVKLPGNRTRVLVEGDQRAKLQRVTQFAPCLLGDIVVLPALATKVSPEVDALIRVAKGYLEGFVQVSNRLSADNAQKILSVEDPGQLADIIAANAFPKYEDQQHILETMDPISRLQEACKLLARETELAELERQVQTRVREQMEQNQKDYFLREQIKAIQSELGDRDSTDVDELRERLKSSAMNDEARDRAQHELDRLSRMAPGSPEIGVSRTYVEWLLDLPWGIMTPDNLDLGRAHRILSEDHYGLDEVKERIVEYLAVLRIRNNMKGPVLCFVGPPGVGKTSIAKSIARALGREFVQMSLGGVRDEAEIRGHRRTYIGAIPGRIISSMKQAKTMNPVFLFDEIDKVGSDVHGDPASALLEVLDSAQNANFRDHYLEAPFDLSRVLFIMTANTTDTIPRPLLDRMEVIELGGYTEDEKLQIATRHLLPNQMDEHGLAKRSVKIRENVMRMVIRGYTLEAGVRVLQRTLGKIVRKSAVEMLDTGVESINISKAKLEAYLGVPRFHYERAEKKPEVGVVCGLAWTAAGGDILKVEAAVMPGTGALELTGNLGDVMKESARAARSWVREHAWEHGIAEDFYKTCDIHIHVPEGAVPKDGPSAGVTLTTALISALTGRPVRQNVAMTGEITLRGRVLPIGGLKEKLLAAHRAGIDTVLIPEENVKDLERIPDNVKGALTILPVNQVLSVLEVALEPESKGKPRALVKVERKGKEESGADQKG